jgi:hypothetical protein
MASDERPPFDTQRAARQADCYAHGLSPRRAGRRLSPVEWRRMTERYREQAAALMLVEAVARSAVRRSRPTTTPACAYLALARETYGRWRRYTGATLGQELELVKRRWLDRGLDAELVGRIVAAVRDTLDRLADRGDEPC